MVEVRQLCIEPQLATLQVGIARLQMFRNLTSLKQRITEQGMIGSQVGRRDGHDERLLNDVVFVRQPINRGLDRVGPAEDMRRINPPTFALCKRTNALGLQGLPRTRRRVTCRLTNIAHSGSPFPGELGD